MERDDSIIRKLSFDRLTVEGFRSEGFKLRQLVEKVIDHHVANEEDAVPGLPFCHKMVDPALLGNEEEIGNGVRDDTVDFLRHPHIAAAEPCLDMGYLDVL